MGRYLSNSTNCKNFCHWIVFVAVIETRKKDGQNIKNWIKKLLSDQETCTSVGISLHFLSGGHFREPEVLGEPMDKK